MARLIHTEQLAQKEAFLLEAALMALQEATGLHGQVISESSTSDQRREDAVIEIDVAGFARRYHVEIKRVDRFAAVSQIKSQRHQLSLPTLLVTHRVTSAVADKCRELDVQFIDTHGNAFLHGPSWFVLRVGQHAAAKEATGFDSMDMPRTGTVTAARIMFALLCRPELTHAPYREIKRITNVALGAISSVFADLNKRGLVTSGRNGEDRRILERQRMIDEWVINYPIKLRPKLSAKRFHAEQQDWWKQLDVTRYEAQWGGEVAADKLTGHLKPNTVTLYMRPERMRQNLSKLVVDNKLRAAPDGEIEVLETFWNFELDHAVDSVPPLLVYADLLASMDPRNFNVGKIIQEQYLHESAAQT